MDSLNFYPKTEHTMDTASETPKTSINLLILYLYSCTWTPLVYSYKTRYSSAVHAILYLGITKESQYWDIWMPEFSVHLLIFSNVISYLCLYTHPQFESLTSSSNPLGSKHCSLGDVFQPLLILPTKIRNHLLWLNLSHNSASWTFFLLRDHWYRPQALNTSLFTSASQINDLLYNEAH